MAVKKDVTKISHFWWWFFNPLPLRERKEMFIWTDAVITDYIVPYQPDRVQFSQLSHDLFYLFVVWAVCRLAKKCPSIHSHRFWFPHHKKLLQTEETEKKILTPFLFKRSTRHKTWAYQPFCCHSCIELEQRLLLHRGVLLFDDFNREIPVAFWTKKELCVGYIPWPC